jgi:hypothetical protein
MGELYPDNIERLLVPEWQIGSDSDSTRKQETKAVKDFQRRQPVPVSGMWPTVAYDKDDKREILLSGTR